MPRRDSGLLRQRGTGGEEKRARFSSGDARPTGFIVSCVFYFLMDTTEAFLEVLWKAIGLPQRGHENNTLACLMYIARYQRCCCIHFSNSAILSLAILLCTLFRCRLREVTLKDQKSPSPSRADAEVREQKEKALDGILNARTYSAHCLPGYRCGGSDRSIVAMDVAKMCTCVCVCGWVCAEEGSGGE